MLTMVKHHYFDAIESNVVSGDGGITQKWCLQVQSGKAFVVLLVGLLSPGRKEHKLLPLLPTLVVATTTHNYAVVEALSHAKAANVLLLLQLINYKPEANLKK